LEFGQRQALQLWRDVVLTGVRAAEPDLTARQVAVLMAVYLEAGQQTVRGLAGALNVGKPAIVRALDALEGLALLRRVRDPRDGRNVLIQGTREGLAWIAMLGQRIALHAGATLNPTLVPVRDAA
jgi:DNA-binding MarR family transcriptional regulator